MAAGSFCVYLEICLHHDYFVPLHFFKILFTYEKIIQLNVGEKSQTIELIIEVDVHVQEHPSSHASNMTLECSVAPEQPSAPRGPKTQYLFVDRQGNEDVLRTQLETERMLRFIADHHFGNDCLDTKQNNKLNHLFVCFWYRWRELGWVASTPYGLGAAIYRFLTENCGIKCEVTPKALSAVICRMVNNGQKDRDMYDDLREYFEELN